MQSDKELLELAARAAGIEYGADRLDSGVSITLPTGRHRHFPKWNPLTDDGDALRLAVSLGLSIRIDNNAGFTWVRRFDHSTPHEGDAHAATRLAIVRAAAAIGQTLPEKQP
jgi:hypothetical protein